MREEVSPISQVERSDSLDNKNKPESSSEDSGIEGKQKITEKKPFKFDKEVPAKYFPKKNPYDKSSKDGSSRIRLSELLDLTDEEESSSQKKSKDVSDTDHTDEPVKIESTDNETSVGSHELTGESYEEGLKPIDARKRLKSSMSFDYKSVDFSEENRSLSTDKETSSLQEKFESLKDFLRDNESKKLVFFVAGIVLLIGFIVFVKIAFLNNKKDTKNLNNNIVAVATLSLTPSPTPIAVSPTAVVSSPASPSSSPAAGSPTPEITASATIQPTPLPTASMAPTSSPAVPSPEITAVAGEGKVAIESDIKGAEIRIFSSAGIHVKDIIKEELGKVTIVKVKPGVYTIRILKKDHYPIEKRKVQISAENMFVISDALVPTPTLTIKTNVPARIFLDGKQAGITDKKSLTYIIHSVSEGKSYKVQAKKDGYNSDEKTINIKKNSKNETLSLTLKAIPAPEPAANSGSYGNSGSSDRGWRPAPSYSGGYRGGSYGGSSYSGGGSRRSVSDPVRRE
jgi:uncharacterized membrane protein YgcG